MARSRPNARSRQGCWTCRAKKVKCDEERPQCQRCQRLGRQCDYAPRSRKPYTKKSRPDSPLQTHQGNLASSPVVPSESLSHGDVFTSPSAITPYTPVPSSFRPSSADKEAIHYFRTVISESVDTKDPAFSVPAIIASLGESDPMVMHMVCALGFQERCYQRAVDPSPAVKHYSASMVLLAKAVQSPSRTRASDLDGILASLWLMILYEQRYGDGIGQGLVAHLRGAAMVLKHRLGNLRRLLEQNFSEPDEQWRISALAGRLIVWISFLDASAESH
ncbi:hypothetical protein BO70DRAFT_364317, partial [Aspergillus heteromorphus CBS 117.55]